MFQHFPTIDFQGIFLFVSGRVSKKNARVSNHKKLGGLEDEFPVSLFCSKSANGLNEFLTKSTKMTLLPGKKSTYWDVHGT